MFWIFLLEKIKHCGDKDDWCLQKMSETKKPVYFCWVKKYGDVKIAAIFCVIWYKQSVYFFKKELFNPFFHLMVVFQ